MDLEKKWNKRFALVMAIVTLVSCGFALTDSRVVYQVIDAALALAGAVETIYFAELVMREVR